MTPLLSTLVLIAATASPAPTRLEQLVEANVLGTHAFQVALSKKEGKSDPACYSAGALTDAQLAALETHQAALLKTDLKAVRAWAEGRPSSFDPKADLEPLLGSGLTLADTLPVNVFRTRPRCTSISGFILPSSVSLTGRASAGVFRTILSIASHPSRA